MREFGLAALQSLIHKADVHVHCGNNLHILCSFYRDLSRMTSRFLIKSLDDARYHANIIIFTFFSGSNGCKFVW